MRPLVKLSRSGEITCWVDCGIAGKYIQGVVATVTLPAFEAGKGNLNLRVTRQKDSFGPDIAFGYSKQRPVMPVEIVQLKDAKTNNIIGLQYHYRPQDKYFSGVRDNRFYAKANVTTSGSFRIPALPPGTTKSDEDSPHVVKDGVFESNPPGWIYAEQIDT